MLVDFMMIGAQKSGTTSIASQLEAHPEICFCKIKEPGFFHQTPLWQTQLDEYHQLFSPENGQLCGEASTMYTFLPEWPDTPARLHDYNPNLKLIYVMRQPVDRIISHYTHNWVRNFVTDAPEKVVLSDPTYVNRSRYAVQIRPYIELFGRENILLLIFEEYVRDQIDSLQQIGAFLGIDSTSFLDADTEPKHKSVGETYLKYEGARLLVRSKLFKQVRDYIPASLRYAVRRPLSNKIKQKPAFSPELKKLLWRLVQDDVTQIEAYLNRDLPQWRQGFCE